MPIPGKKYRPSNGTEGEMFMDRWCFSGCIREIDYQAGKAPACVIMGNSLAYSVSDPLYPPEWTFDAEGQPCCTAYQTEEQRPDPNAHLQNDLPFDGS